MLNIAVNLIRGHKAQKFNNTTDEWKPPHSNNELALDSSKAQEAIKRQVGYIQGYKKRITALIDSCTQHNILPVFLTQPWLYGEGVDSVTDVNLATYNIGNGRNGALFWRILQQYNEAVKEVCKEKHVPVIDLAVKMPKNSIYYYDASHYTNKGAEMVAQLVGNELVKILQERF